MFSHKKKRSDREGTIQTQAAQSQFSPKPFGIQQTTEVSQSSPVDLQAQYESARQGFNFGNIAISPPKNAFPAIQKKVTVGKAGDKYEQEAEQVAPKVVQSINLPSTEVGNSELGVQKQQEQSSHAQINPIQAYRQQTVQRERDKYVTNRPVGGGLRVQPQKENRGIENFRNMSPMLQLMRENFIQKNQDMQWNQQGMKANSIQRQEKEEELAMKPDSSIQRNNMEMEEENIQGKGLQGGAVTSEFEQKLQKAKSAGQPLQPELQAKMGQAMGADFSGVKVHNDVRSDQLNQSIQAKAFTTGSDVFFKQGAYNPNSRHGQELIAHELTHVVQQTGASSHVQRQDDNVLQRKIYPNEKMEPTKAIDPDIVRQKLLSRSILNKETEQILRYYSGEKEHISIGELIQKMKTTISVNAKRKAELDAENEEENAYVAEQKALLRVNRRLPEIIPYNIPEIDNKEAAEIFSNKPLPLDGGDDYANMLQYQKIYLGNEYHEIKNEEIPAYFRAISLFDPQSEHKDMTSENLLTMIDMIVDKSMKPICWASGFDEGSGYDTAKNNPGNLLPVIWPQSVKLKKGKEVYRGDKRAPWDSTIKDNQGLSAWSETKEEGIYGKNIMRHTFLPLS